MTNKLEIQRVQQKIDELDMTIHRQRRHNTPHSLDMIKKLESMKKPLYNELLKLKKL